MNHAPYQLSRRSFIKVVTSFLGAAMGTLLGLPAIGYLISPAKGAQKTTEYH